MRDYSHQNRQLQQTLARYVEREKIPFAELARRAGFIPNTVQWWFAEREKAIAIPVEKLRGLEDALNIPVEERQTLPKGFGTEYLRVVAIRLGEDSDKTLAILHTYELPDKNLAKLALGSSVGQVLTYFYKASGKMQQQIAQETQRQRQSVGIILKGQIGKCSVFDMGAIEDCIDVPIMYRLTAPRNFADIYRDLLKGYYTQGLTVAQKRQPLEAVTQEQRRPPVPDLDYGILPHSIISALPPRQQADVANLYLFSLYQMAHDIAKSGKPSAIDEFKKSLDVNLLNNAGGLLLSFQGDRERMDRFFTFNKPPTPKEVKSHRRRK